MKKFFAILALSVLCFGASSVRAEDADQIFARIKDFDSKGNFPKAIEEVEWLKKELQKKHMQKIQTLLPQKIGDLAGEPAKAQGALGFHTIERNYGAAGQGIKLTISGGGLGGATAGMGSLAALGQMAAAMGGENLNTETFRLAGATANIESKPENKSAELTVFLQSGSILQLEQDGSADAAALKTKAQSIEAQIQALDNYLRGVQG